ncbi:polysaccharide pyruvyl transferase family protein [Aquimarina sp. U1-2]|uniref:polysaccharide pyruvyl transferase family protein n=1 Tax=Aquimarina sp. U1-2 TaxID=2823141 RepID=UPI001AEC74AF|nr:polysaccharide pyruvyl transferase family protein [Aquimarina sp. U1-2]MBP2832019.1 polysaccharide pyruvyl transferase family protein [Aquimarina sp. U1-2]
MIKKYIPFSFKAKLLTLYYKTKSFKSLNETFKITSTDKKKVFIFLAADYGNLGDVAITYAQHKFLKQSFPDYTVIEIPLSWTFSGIALVQKIITPSDIITTVGGGNMGDLYHQIECQRQLVFSEFKNNQVISFPQTIDFTDTKSGKQKLKTAIRVYSSHPNLILLAREQKTFDFFKKHFKKNKIFLVPDIVLTLDRSQDSKKREGVIICLRNDKEKKLSSTEEKSLLEMVKGNFGSFKERDTHIGGSGLSMRARVQSLFAIWDDFKSARLVITDRLHGMIFCYITKTPALVFLNNNHKIKSSYSWIKETNNIHLIENFDKEKIEKLIFEVKNDTDKSSKVDLLHFYSDLKKEIISN